MIAAGLFRFKAAGVRAGPTSDGASFQPLLSFFGGGGGPVTPFVARGGGGITGAGRGCCLR